MKQMYKVFLNDRLINIGASVNITLNKSTVKFDRSCTAEEIKNWFNYFLDSDLEEVSFIHPEPVRFFRLFKSAFLVVLAAGGVVVFGEELLFIFRNGKWDLPKGKVDKGESPEKAALREVEEEAGISCHRIKRQLRSTFHIYHSPYPETQGQWIFKETYWFEMRCNSKPTGSPQKEEGITEVRWFHKNALGEVMSNTYENLKQILISFTEVNSKG